jgi:hypothetical protein
LTKNERRDAVCFIGLVIVIVGVMLVWNAVTGEWNFQTAPSKVIQLIGGGFVAGIGVILVGAALDVLDELDNALYGIYERFLEALGR